MVLGERRQDRCQGLELNLRWVCPKHGRSLVRRERAVECPDGCSFPLVNGILRFVPQDNYASSFGLQWNRYRTTQLDSYTGLTITRDRLTRLLGGSLEPVRGKTILEAGCGAGRFSEILLEAGAHLQAVDLSSAVEANHANCRGFDHYSVCQASIVELPFAPEQFDIVICIGVIQHTPDPEETMAALCRQVKPGGMLVVDHYTYGYASTLSRRMLRALLLRMPKTFSLRFCETLTSLVWPLHELLWAMRSLPLVARIRSHFMSVNGGFEVHENGGEKCTLWRGVTPLGGQGLLPVAAARGGAA